jgi:hypothetical protein
MRTPSGGPARASTPASLLKRLRRDLLGAQLALGERMSAAGIDDGYLGPYIAALDRRIRRAAEARLPVGPLLAQRRQLLLRLAAAALEEDAPLPGADAEYQKARHAQEALRKAEAGADTARPEPVAVGT